MLREDDDISEIMDFLDSEAEDEDEENTTTVLRKRPSNP